MFSEEKYLIFAQTHYFKKVSEIYNKHKTSTLEPTYEISVNRLSR